MLQVKSLTKTYQGKTILKRLQLNVREGEIVAISGKSGSGKTTLLLCLLGFIPSDAGRIILTGEDITAQSIQDRKLAYVPQEYGLFPHLSVKDNIAFGLRTRGIGYDAVEKIVHRLIKVVKLPAALLERNVKTLSGGEQQRVALARALAIQPKLFLLDEPLSAIDPETKQLVRKQLRALIKKLRIPAVIVTHDLQDARALGDTLYRLEKGQLKRIPSTTGK